MNQKPKPPITLYVLPLVAIAGLLALFLAARAAFITIAGSGQAAAAALLIEAGAVVEALTLARSRNKIAGGGLLISYLVSASYNYTQAHDARPDLVGFQLLAFALGPLSALTFISLALGEELRQHNGRLAVWQAGQDARRLQAEAERERQEAEALDYQRQVEREQREWERNQERLARLRAERRQADRTVSTFVDSVRSMSGQADPARQWPDKASFLSDADRPDDLKVEQLSQMADISERTARRWLAEARGQPVAAAGLSAGRNGK